MKEVYDLRMYLSELIAELSPREITKDHLQAMEVLLERTKTMYDQRDSVAYGRLCNELHEVLISLIGSVPLRESPTICTTAQLEFGLPISQT